jgi:hypothetical protein
MVFYPQSNKGDGMARGAEEVAEKRRSCGRKKKGGGHAVPRNKRI